MNGLTLVFETKTKLKMKGKKRDWMTWYGFGQPEIWFNKACFDQGSPSLAQDSPIQPGTEFDWQLLLLKMYF